MHSNIGAGSGGGGSGSGREPADESTKGANEKPEWMTQHIEDFDGAVIVIRETDPSTHFVISNIKNTVVVVLKTSQVVKVNNAVMSRIFFAVCSDQVLLNNCDGCSISGICQNLLVNQCHDNLLYISSQERPYIVGGLDNNLFATFNGRCPIVQRELDALKGVLNPENAVHTKCVVVSEKSEHETSIKTLPQVRQSELTLKHHVTQFGVEKLFELFSSLDVKLNGRLNDAAVHLLNAAFESVDVELIEGTEDGLSFHQFEQHVVSKLVHVRKANDREPRPTMAPRTLERFLDHLGIDLESTPAWVVHVPTGEGEKPPAVADLERAASALKLATVQPDKSQDASDELSAGDPGQNLKLTTSIASSTPVPTEVKKITHAHSNPMLLSVHRVRAPKSRSLERLEAALAILFKDSTRFNQIRRALQRRLAAKSKTTVSRIDLWTCFKTIVDKRSPLFRRYGQMIFFSKDECAAILHHASAWFRTSQHAPDEQLERDYGGGGGDGGGGNTLSNGNTKVLLSIKNNEHPQLDAFILYLRIFRPSHQQAPQSFSDWERDVGGRTGRFSTKFQLERALTGDIVGSQVWLLAFKMIHSPFF